MFQIERLDIPAVAAHQLTKATPARSNSFDCKIEKFVSDKLEWEKGFITYSYNQTILTQTYYSR